MKKHQKIASIFLAVVILFSLAIFPNTNFQPAKSAMAFDPPQYPFCENIFYLAKIEHISSNLNAKGKYDVKIEIEKQYETSKVSRDIFYNTIQIEKKIQIAEDFRYILCINKNKEILAIFRFSNEKIYVPKYYFNQDPTYSKYNNTVIEEFSQHDKFEDGMTERNFEKLLDEMSITFDSWQDLYDDIDYLYSPEAIEIANKLNQEIEFYNSKIKLLKIMPTILICFFVAVFAIFIIIYIVKNKKKGALCKQKGEKYD